MPVCSDSSTRKTSITPSSSDEDETEEPDIEELPVKGEKYYCMLYICIYVNIYIKQYIVVQHMRHKAIKILSVHVCMQIGFCQ